MGNKIHGNSFTGHSVFSGRSDIGREGYDTRVRKVDTQCRNCARVIFPGSKFCSHCGKDPTAAPCPKPKCAVCKNGTLKIDTAYCANCGTESK